MWLKKKQLREKMLTPNTFMGICERTLFVLLWSKLRVPRQLMVLQVDFPVTVPVAWSAATETACICCTCFHWCDFHRESGSARKIRSIFIQKYEDKTFFQLNCWTWCVINSFTELMNLRFIQLICILLLHEQFWSRSPEPFPSGSAPLALGRPA